MSSLELLKQCNFQMLQSGCPPRLYEKFKVKFELIRWRYGVWPN